MLFKVKQWQKMYSYIQWYWGRGVRDISALSHDFLCLKYINLSLTAQYYLVMWFCNKLRKTIILSLLYFSFLSSKYIIHYSVSHPWVLPCSFSFEKHYIEAVIVLSVSLDRLSTLLVIFELLYRWLRLVSFNRRLHLRLPFTGIGDKN